MEWWPWIVAAAFWLASFGATWYVADQRGRYVEEAVIFGLLLGPLGILVVGMLPELDEDEARREKPAGPLEDALRSSSR